MSGLMIETGGHKTAYDWGLPCFDRQHYEGYTVELDYLLYAVRADFDAETSYPAGEIAYSALDPDSN